MGSVMESKANRTWHGFRLPPAILAAANARAEAEGVTLTSIIEDRITRYARGLAEQPEVVQERLRSRGIRFTRRATST